MAAIDGDGRAGHVAPGVGAEQQQRAVEILRPAEAALRNALDERLAGVAERRTRG